MRRFRGPSAQVAKLVDALASGASARKSMEVRVLFSAQKRVLSLERKLPKLF